MLKEAKTVKLNKRFLASFLVVIFAFTLAFGVNTLSAQEVELSFAHIYAPDHPFNVAAEEIIAEDIAERTDGEVVLEVYPGGALGTEHEIAESVITGAIDIGIVGPGVLGEYVEDWLVPEAAFVFDGPDHMLNVMDGEIGEEMKDELYEETGMRTLMVGYYGTRYLTANERVETPEDMEGLAIRAPDMPQSVRNTEAMGAEATPLAFEEVYTSLATGVVDGQENPLPTIETEGFYEVQDYLVDTAHVVQATPFVMGDLSYQELTPEQQNVVEEVFAEHQETIYEMVLEDEKKILEEFEEEELIEYVEPDREAFIRRVLEDYLDNWDGVYWSEGLYEEIRAVAN